MKLPITLTALVLLALLFVIARAAFLTERVHLDLVLADPTLEFAVHSSFGEDTRGRLYVVSLRGEIYRLTETRPAHQLSDFLRLAAFQ